MVAQLSRGGGIVGSVNYYWGPPISDSRGPDKVYKDTRKKLKKKKTGQPFVLNATTDSNSLC